MNFLRPPVKVNSLFAMLVLASIFQTFILGPESFHYNHTRFSLVWFRDSSGMFHYQGM